MRLFEIVILILLTFSGILILCKKDKSKYFFGVSTITVILLLAHLLSEKYRWQMIPAYSLSGFIFLWSVKNNFRIKKNLANEKSIYKIISIMVFFVWLCGAIILPYVLPVIDLPEPTGPYKIGTKYLLLTDHDRNEIYATDTTEKRELPIQVWYPAETDESAVPEPYLKNPGIISKAFAKSQGIPFIPFILNHMNLVKTNSYLNSPIIENNGKYPVVLFSHGLNQFYKFNTSLMEELASNGYVVFSISHPYDTPCAVYPDGTVKSYKKKNNIGVNTDTYSHETDQKLRTIYEKIQKTNDVSEQRSLYKEFYALQPQWWHISNDVWLQDSRYVIDKMDSLNRNLFTGQLDVNQIGVMGFSFGGGTAGLLAMTDDRVKAGINLDAWQPGHTLETNISCPFMYMSSAGHEESFEFFMKNADTTVYSLNFKNFKHPNFNDMSLIAEIPGKLVSLSGRIDGKFGLGIVKEYSIIFFNKYLKNIDPQLLINPPVDSSEVKFRMN